MEFFDPIHHYLPSRIVNNPLGVALPGAYAFLAVATFSLTFPQHNSVLRYFRLLLFIPTLALLTVAWFPKGLEAGLTVLFFWIGVLCFFKSFDVMVVAFGDREDETPRWISLKWTRDGGKEEVIQTPLPLSADLGSRVAYTLDSICTIQGGSFFKDTAFDWAPPPIYQYRSGGQKAFLSTRLKNTALEWFMMDLLETIVAEGGWDIHVAAPLTGSGLPIIVQLFYAGCFGLLSYFATFMHINTLILISVAAFHLNPDSWPPIWRNP